MARRPNASILPSDLAQAYARISALEEQVKRLQPVPSSVLEVIPDALAVLDREFRCVWMNSEAERLLKTPARDLLGRRPWKIFPATANQTLEEKCQQAAANQEALEFECFAAPWKRWFFFKVCPTKEGGMALCWREITEHKATEAKLRWQTMELEQVYDSIVTTDLEGRIVRWNHGAERIYGYEPREVIGESAAMLFFEEERSRFRETILEPILREGRREVELRIRRKNGAGLYLQLRLSVLRDDDGLPYGIFGVAIDITEQKRAEEALRASEELYRLASQAVDGIVYDWYPQSGLVKRSGDLYKLIGTSVEEAEPCDRWWQERVHPADQGASSLGAIAPLARGQNHFTAEYRFKHANGDWVYLCDRGFIVRDENGVPVRVAGSTYDVTERKRLEAALYEKHQQLEFQAHLLEATSDVLVVLDPNLNIRYCNAAAERMYGVQRSDVIGQPLPAMHGYAWLKKEDESRFFSEWAEHGSWTGEYIHLLKDGSQRVVHATVNTLGSEAGGGIIAVIRDISQKKQAELQTASQTAQLQRANEDLLYFAYGVSHDLQAPLRTVTSFSQLLALKYRASLDGPGSEYIRWIVEASVRMDTMLRDLLQFAKVAGSRVDLDEEAALEEALSKALESLRTSIEESNAEITYDALPRVAGDAGQFMQLFQNLIGNSLKYRRPDTPSRIQVSARRSGEEWIIEVSDNGLGFDAKYAERIFGVFQRLHGKEVAGTGIGLTICKRIVERHGGRISATGTPGSGATFSFTIPDSRVSLHTEPPIEWGRVSDALENGQVQREESVLSGHFDELFKALDLAQAIVRRLDGAILIWTKGAERLFGWTEEEALGQQLHTMIRTEFPISEAKIGAEILKSGEWKGELKAKKKDGTPVWLASHQVLYRDGSGRPESVIEVHNDITAVQNAEEALFQSRELAELRLREIEALYSQAPVGLLFLDTELRFVRINEHLARLNGLAIADHLGRTVAEVLPEAGPRLQTVLRQVIDTRTPLIEVEMAASGRMWLVSYFPFDGADGQCLGLNGVVQDITQRKQQEAYSVELNERLRIATSLGKLGVFTWFTASDRVQWENQRMYEITGRPLEEGPLNHAAFLAGMVYPEDAGNYETALREAMKPGGKFRHVCRIKRGDGVLRWVECAGQFDLTPDGSSLRLVGVLADVTFQRENETGGNI